MAKSLWQSELSAKPFLDIGVITSHTSAMSGYYARNSLWALLLLPLIACGSDSNTTLDGGTGDGDGGNNSDGGTIDPPAMGCTPIQDDSPKFYVSVSGSNESGDGSEGSPWATIGHGIRQIPDASTLLVGAGTYSGRIRLDSQFSTGVRIRAEPMYQAKLRHNGTVVTAYSGQGITLEGFDISHDGPGSSALIIQIQDANENFGGPDATSRITIRNNILHDSYDNDILKINNGAREIVVERNIFYNQTGSDEHIDINSVADVVVQDNIFFNDFAASGRTDTGETSSYIVIKDSNGNDDSYEGSQRITVRRNVFLNWQGNAGTNFLLIGEDGNAYHEAADLVLENNLFVGNSANEMRASFGIKGARDVLFRHNTIVGNLPSSAFAFRINTEGANPANQNINVYNNIWSDPTGTMEDFSDTPSGETSSFELDNNLYWNGGSAIPQDTTNDMINRTDDSAGVEGDPMIGSEAVVLPTWDENNSVFADGSGDVCAAFEKLVRKHGMPASGSAAAGAARSDQSPATDILGKSRAGSSSIGAVEPE